MDGFFQNPENLAWLSFGLKTIYIVIYGGLTYQLFCAASNKLNELKDKNNE